jgi:hypothetical protein
MAHPVGIGNSKGWFPNYEGYADGACFLGLRRDVFDQAGLYAEKCIRIQDDEFTGLLAAAGRSRQN